MQPYAKIHFKGFMWEYVENCYIYAKIYDRHCSVWYDADIQKWRWTTIALTVNGIKMQMGDALSASSCMGIVERIATDEYNQRQVSETQDVYYHEAV
jgi:hypothetical protein